MRQDKKSIFQSANIRLSKVRVDGSDVNANSLIKQLSVYRKASRLKHKDIKDLCPSIGSTSHIAGIEAMRQRETTIHLIEYCQALGIKEITIIL